MHDFKKEISRLNDELHTLKHKLFEQKKKEAAMKEKELQWFAENGLISCIESAYGNGQAVGDQTRKGNQSPSPAHYKERVFVGGGFAVK